MKIYFLLHFLMFWLIIVYLVCETHMTWFVSDRENWRTLLVSMELASAKPNSEWSVKTVLRPMVLAWNIASWAKVEKACSKEDFTYIILLKMKSFRPYEVFKKISFFDWHIKTEKAWHLFHWRLSTLLKPMIVYWTHGISHQ